MEVIKKAYHQESECEDVEVSPREVGHNIYILAQQVTEHELLSANRHCVFRVHRIHNNSKPYGKKRL